MDACNVETTCPVGVLFSCDACCCCCCCCCCCGGGGGGEASGRSSNSCRIHCVGHTIDLFRHLFALCMTLTCCVNFSTISCKVAWLTTLVPNHHWVLSFSFVDSFVLSCSFTFVSFLIVCCSNAHGSCSATKTAADG